MQSQSDRPKDQPREQGEQEESAHPNLRHEFVKLVQLATLYPDIGPPVAELAFKTGYSEQGNQILRLALEREAPGLEYYSIAARYKKQNGQYEEALRYCVAAVCGFAAAPDRYPTPDDAAKLLHLVRLGFTILLFELKDPQGNPPFITALSTELPKLAPRMDADPFYHSLIAQVLWYTDREQSEKEWEVAAERGEPELTFNARGTWYKEAEHDADKAEKAYRQGLLKAPQSSLLLHNLAQLLLDKAARHKEEPEVARPLLYEADGLIRTALQGDCPKGLRRHIYNTRGEIAGLRATLRPRRNEAERRPPEQRERQAGGQERPEQRPEPKERTEPKDKIDEERLAQLQPGQVVRGKVISLAAFGAFVDLEGNISGLLHKSELAHEHVTDPAQVLQVGQEIEVKILDIQRKEQGRPRIGLSRKAVLPPPAAPEKDAQARGPGRPRQQQGQGAGGYDAASRQHARPGQEGPRHRDDRPRDRPGERPGDRPGDRQGPRPGPRDQQSRPRGRDRGPEVPGTRPSPEKLASLGEMLLAKLKEQENKG